MATTTNYGWTTPDNTDAVTNGALAIRTLGEAIDGTLFDVAASAAGLQWQPGGVYTNGLSAGGNFAQTTLTTANYIPFYVPNDVTLASVSVKVSDAAASATTTKLAIYNADPTTLKPTTRVVDLGNFSGISTGIKTISTTQALTAGYYWVAILLNQTSSYALTDSFANENSRLQIVNTGISKAFNTAGIGCYSATDAAFPTADITASTFTSVSEAPLVAIQVA